MLIYITSCIGMLLLFELLILPKKKKERLWNKIDKTNRRQLRFFLWMLFVFIFASIVTYTESRLQVNKTVGTIIEGAMLGIMFGVNPISVGIDKK